MRKKLINTVLTIEELERSKQEHQSLCGMSKDFGISLRMLENTLDFHDLEHPDKFKRNSVNHNFFSNINEESLYIAGFIAADGNVYQRINGSNTIKIQLATKDKQHLLNIAKKLEFNGDINDYTINAREFIAGEKTKQELYYSSYLSFNSDQICNDLEKFGIVPNKTYIYTMPLWLVKHPLVHHFIRGYIDGDGWIGYGKDSNEIKRIVIGLVGACPAVKEIFDIIHDRCHLRSGGCFSIQKNIYNTEIKTFSFAGLLDVETIIKFLYKDATIYLERKFEPTKQIYNLIDKSKLYLFDPQILQNQCNEIGNAVKIAELYNCSQSTILKAIKEFNLNFQTKMEFDLELLQKQYNELGNCGLVAELYDCSRSVIERTMRKFKLKFKPHHDRNFPRKYQFDPQILQQQYNLLGSLNKVAKLYNCDHNTIKCAMKKFGIPLNPNNKSVIK